MTVVDAQWVEKVTAEAREVKFWRTLLTVLGALLYGFGWLVGKVFTVAWIALAWMGLAIREGWRSARNEAREAGG